MGIRSWFGLTESHSAVTETPAIVDRLSEQLRQEQETSLLLQESIVDLQLSLEDAEWRRLSAWGDMEFTREGLTRAAQLCRLTAVANPLMKRGVAIRVGYIWGEGVSIQARAGEEAPQDVNAVVQAFLDDPSNQATLTGSQAREENERGLATDGNLFLACFTSPLDGRVQVRTVPFDEIHDVICNPDDRDDPWFYRRVYTRTVIDLSGALTTEMRTEFYPALGYRPATRLRQVRDGTGVHPVMWDAPVRHIRVNALDGWKFGIGDCYASLPWCRSYKEFLEDWATLVKALSRFAWRATTKGNKTPGVKARIAAKPAQDPLTGEPLHAGATAVMDPSTSLEAIPKTGATIDSESGRPLAAMTAAGLDVPVTMLLGDPGTTGARAVAETLDQPTENAMNLRRQLWTDVLRDLLGYVVDQAVKAPRGPLRGTVTRDGNREVVTLAGDVEKTVEIVWPEFDSMPLDVLVKAIVAADSTMKMHPLMVARLLLEALGVDNVDEALDELTDDQGNFVDPMVNAGQAAVDAFRRGQDPASRLDGAPEPDE